MRKLQSQGVHHTTLVGADRQTSIDFWEGVLGMPFVFEQPNLDNAAESHLYFDPGDGRLITVFTNEDRTPDPTRTPIDPGCVHHLAFALSQATFAQAVERLNERGIRHSGVKDRGFMDSIYFTDPLGLLIELAAYRFEPPAGHTHAEVLLAAHRIRVERGDYNIAPVHLADAIEQLVTESRQSLSNDRTPKDPTPAISFQTATGPCRQKLDEEEESMGRIVVSEFVTLDGVVEDPGGAEGSPSGGWAFKFDRGDEGDRFKTEELMNTDALLLGRRTYEGFAVAWPNMNEDPFGQKMNSMPKYVVSSTLTKADWTNSTILPGDLAEEATRLRDEVGEILVAGSRQLVNGLHAHGLIDEYRLMVYPIVLGAGARLFDDSAAQATLRLVEAKPAGDILLLTYHRA